ncbi:MAG TPA: hypothetical protein DEA22_06175, partial [Blastocatellia bacterium]|nr:hypothetical protein [Blastocatellia bacterium]
GNAVFAFLVDISYKRRIFEVLLDAMLITLSYYAAYVMLFGSFETSGNWELFMKSLPMLVILKLFAFLTAGVYRGIWRYTSIADFITFSKAVLFGTILSVMAILAVYRFQNFSRSVFVLDGIILLFALVGSRMAFRLFAELLPKNDANGGRRVLIYGAGDGGEMVLREFRRNSEWNYHPVAFIDDDELKVKKVINGLMVYDANGSLAELCREKEIDDIIVSFRGLNPTKLAEIRELCRSANVGLKRAEMTVESLEIG